MTVLHNTRLHGVPQSNGQTEGLLLWTSPHPTAHSASRTRTSLTLLIIWSRILSLTSPEGGLPSERLCWESGTEQWMSSDTPLSTLLTTYSERGVQENNDNLTMWDRQLRRDERVLARREGNKICVSTYGIENARERQKDTVRLLTFPSCTHLH